MPMENRRERDEGSGSGSGKGSSSPPAAAAVLAIECVAGSSKADEWNEDMLQTGDVVEEIRIGGQAPVRAPFKGGRSAVQKLLHAAYRRDDTSILVRVRRGSDSVELQACIVPNNESSGLRRTTYVVRSIHDPNYAVGFVDRSESECAQMQGSRSSRVACALSKAQLRDGYVSYPWEKKMRESLPIPNSSSLLSLLVFPKALDAANSRYNTLEDTLARANAWLNSSQAAGVPIVFMNVQAEALLTKISGETASAAVTAGSMSDISGLANASLYGFEDYHGVDIGVMRAVRLWYTSVAGEYSVEIKPHESDTKLGFSVSRTEEGFIYISEVCGDDDERASSTRSGLRELYREAARASKLLVISRVSSEKVLPWMVSTSGAIRCFDTVSLSQKLSLHRHALRPILIHVLMWDRQQQQLHSPGGVGGGSSRIRAVAPSVVPLLQTPELDHLVRDMSLGDRSVDARLIRDVVGEASFRFIDYPIPNNNWV